MLLNLKLKDLILIEKAEIEFGPGLNIITGETGSGKSAILTAIRLIAGERADSEWIRSGASMAVVEATLSPSITIRREIHRSGKSRCFVEDELVSASVLRESMRAQLEMVDQSSSGKLSIPEVERQMLDTYAGLEKEASLLDDAFRRLVLAKEEFESTLATQMNRSRDLEWAESGLQAIEEANWQKDEEESLTRNHLFLTHAQEILEKVLNAGDGLDSILPHLRRFAASLEGAALLDPQLRSIADGVKTTGLELDEAARFLRSYASRLEADPRRLEEVEDRIARIETLKRRFGATWDEVEKQRLQLASDIERLQFLDESIAALRENVTKLENEALLAAKQLSLKRLSAAKAFSAAILEELKCLNLPHAKFEIRLEPKPLSGTGIDEIRFLFSANPGCSPLPLQQCASGGELSRLLFAAKVILAKKESLPCLIFDEIDSNVGGHTATILGAKLKQLAETRQVISVTHFVQVARFAAHHFAVEKKSEEGRAATSIFRLDLPFREREYARMVGNDHFPPSVGK